MTTTTEKVGLIYELMPKIMADIPVIGKDRKNTGQGYNFRGIDDAYNVIHPVLVKHGVFVLAEVIGAPVSTQMPSKSGGTLSCVKVHMRYHFTARDGSSVASESVGDGMDQGDKAAAKATSMAFKQCLFQTFSIPTDEPKDAEVDDPEPAYVAPTPAPAELVTDGQRVVLAKLLDDMQRAGKDVDDIVEKVKAHFGIDGYPGELTKDQAAALIKKWSDGLKKAAK